MKRLFSGLLATAALAAPPALAAYQFELTGPTSFEAGQDASFNIHIRYTPNIVGYTADPNDPNTVSYTFMGSTGVYLGLSIRDSIGQVVQSGMPSTLVTASWFNGGPGGVDPMAAYEYEYAFTQRFDMAGSFDVMANAIFWERTDRYAGAACVMPECDWRMMADSYTAQGGAGTNHLAVNVSAVPEPETYAMLLAGVGVLGAVARRRG